MLFNINKQSIYLGIIFFFITIFSIQRFFITSSGVFETISSYLVYPIVKIQGQISSRIENYKNKKESMNALKNKLDEMQKTNEDLLFENIRLKSSLAHLEQVSELVEFKKKVNLETLITSQIIYKQFFDNGHFAFIDKGSNDNIQKDMVAVYKNCLVGRVSDVYPQYSKIIFITDKSCKIAAYCYKTGANGIYQGDNDLENSELNFVNHLDDIEVEDLLISSGDGLIFPQGFCIGKIVDFKKDQLQYDVKIKPILDLSKIKYCQLIKK